MVAEFRRRRDFVVQGLNDIPGIRCLCPAGAFYVFPTFRASERRVMNLLITCSMKRESPFFPGRHSESMERDI